MKAADRQIESSFFINSTGLFGQELVILHTTPSMFGKFSVHARRECGGLNEEHSILVH